MTDEAALVGAICADPDADTPRLVFADWLDDHDQPDRAAFVRGQLDLARTPAWEPFAVLCRHRRPDLRTGRPFRHTLPPLSPGFGVDWAPEPFRRGLGWAVEVRSLPGWLEVADDLFRRAPVGELHLWGQATAADDWRRFARTAGMATVRAVHLRANPVEPCRAVIAAGGVADLHFHRADHPGLEFLVRDLLGSPAGRAVRGLHFRTGYAGLDDLLDALAGARLDRLGLANMGLTADVLLRWTDRGRPAGLSELDLTDNYSVGNEGTRILTATALRDVPGLHTLRLAGCGATDRGVRELARAEHLFGLRHLDLSRNPLSAKAARHLAESPHLAGLRAVDLSRCRLGDGAVGRLVRAAFWPNLVELDLRGNPITAPAVKDLVSAPLPPDLTALLLDPDPLGPKACGQLRAHFGERLVFS